MNDNKKEFGTVYLLTNPYMPGIVKIGKTSRKDLEVRMKELYNTSIPVPFECAYSCDVDIDKMDALERALHEAFAPNRVNPSREFFEIEPKQAIAIMKFVDANPNESTNDVNTAIKNELTRDDRVANDYIARKKRQHLNFYEMGLSNGDTLTFAENPSITVTIIDAKKVRYVDDEGDVYDISLTDATRRVKGLVENYAIRGIMYWKYNDKILMDIYNETYPIDED